MKTASWVIVRLSDNQVLFETFDEKKVDYLNTNKYKAVPIYTYLVELNKKSQNKFAS